MNIKELKALIKDLPDDTPILEGPQDAGPTSAGECWAEYKPDPKVGVENGFLWIQH